MSKETKPKLLKRESPCVVCGSEEYRIDNTETPQGWPMTVHECVGCKLRELKNDPKADYEKALVKKLRTPDDVAPDDEE